MNQRQRQAVLLALIQHLRDKGSWCGETHLQKSTFFLQELLRVPLRFNMIFYKFGPFSFDLADEITAMRADLLLSVQSREPYGASLVHGDNAPKILLWYGSVVREYLPAIRYVAEQLGQKNVAELERLSTALYVILQLPGATDADRAREITQLKPHVSYDDARLALRAVHTMRTEAEPLRYHEPAPAPPTDRG